MSENQHLDLPLYLHTRFYVCVQEVCADSAVALDIVMGVVWWGRAR